MGQAANSGRGASLDQKKLRAAGRAREHSPEAEAIKDFQAPQSMKGRTAGAFGKYGQANHDGSVGTQGAGGGGGEPATDKGAPIDTPRSSQPARPRNA